MPLSESTGLVVKTHSLSSYIDEHAGHILFFFVEALAKLAITLEVVIGGSTMEVAALSVVDKGEKPK